MTRIMIVDSDPNVRMLVDRYARIEGYEVLQADTGAGALALCRRIHPDFLIVSILLPDMDGFTLCRQIRAVSTVPILILSSCAEEADRIRGLELGADDYLTKPFSPRELMLRVSAILKRGKAVSVTPRVIRAKGVVIDLSARRLEVDGVRVTLRPKEFDLLAQLASHPDQAISRQALLDAVWRGEHPFDTRTLDTHIKQIRRALGPYSRFIVTLRGVGYRFEPD